MRSGALFAAVLTLTLGILPTTAAEINLKSNPTGQTLFPKQQFQLQCWQEGIKIIEEQALRTHATAPELGEHLASFAQGEEGNKLILVTLGQTLCMIKTRT